MTPSFKTQQLLYAVALLTGCAAPKPVSPQPSVEQVLQQTGETTHAWKMGRYQVRFAAGPIQYFREGGLKSFSTYSVLYQEEGRAAITEVAGSAMDIDILIHSPNLHIADCISVWTSPSEKWLLIKEDVPNDCGPCVNYILFERLAEEFKFSYLKLPTWQPPVKSLKGGVIPPVFAENPTILKLTDEEIEYHFSDKKPQRIKIRDAPKKEGVTFPG
jgi:hypothetical protein